MNKKQVMSIVKKLTAVVLAVGMIVAGIAIYPKQADAAVVEDKVIYVEYKADDIQANYWTTDKKTAPVKEGYVFGGWFEQVDTKTNKTETYTEGGKETYYNPLTTVSGDAYAKFVPAQVLSVKAQNGVEKGSSIKEINQTTIKNVDEDNPMYIRVMSSVDSANYQKVGFEIYLANWLKVYKDGTALTTQTNEPTETTKVYAGLLKGDETETANEIFGGESEYLSVWKLSAIDTPDNASLIIYVRPYWVTTDGTKVNGLAKYVHIEDEYMDLISVPINLLGGEAVAAGAVDMTYTDGAIFKGFEKGRILPEMECNPIGNTIKIVGNTNQDVDKYNEGETIYANLRFEKPQSDKEFNIIKKQFCGWDEEIITNMKVWDVKYDAQ